MSETLKSTMDIDVSGIDDNAYRFILDFQSTATVDEVWELFLKTVAQTYPVPVKEAQLVYKAGVLSRVLTSQPARAEIISRELNEKEQPFLETVNEFDFQISGKELLIFKQVDAYFIQVRFLFSVPITGSSHEKNKVLTLSQIFMNQIILLLKIGNFEFHSIKDDITLAYNQKYLRNFIQTEIERCRRYPSIFSLVFFDLDNLKAINEKHGHLIGTEVLKQVAFVLRNQVRKIDLLSRFGGDEFVIVLLKANAAKAYEICSRIKNHMEAATFLEDRHLDLKMTGCFGISSFPRDGDTVEDLIKKADAAMYEVKRTGKNGIKIYEGD